MTSQGANEIEYVPERVWKKLIKGEAKDGLQQRMH